MSKTEAVKVAIRVRPPNKREIQLNSPSCVKTQGNIISIANGKESKEFCFDNVFDQESKQEEVYDSTAYNLVQSSSQGYNGTIFAYGQTGAGKTWTMIGSRVDGSLKGIIPRTFSHLIKIIQSGEAQQYLLSLSFIEIYNEEVRDLLVDLSKVKENKREIKESPDKGVYLKDLIRAQVKSVEDMEKWLLFGDKNRTVHATAMNAVSSRSHAVFTFYLEALNTINGKETIKTGKLNLVDLAGSERQSKTGAEGDRLKEGAKINLSLSALGNVINVLAEGKKGVHIPYRDSKLTRILQDSLGGNTKTIMIASVSPALDNYDETLSTLRYAARAKSIKNAPKINEDPKDALIRQYADEIKRLKEQLTGQVSPTGQMSPEALQELEQRLRNEFSSEKEKAELDRAELIKQKDREREQLIKKLQDMEANLLKRDEAHAAQANKYRNNKKRKIDKQQKLNDQRIQEFQGQNEQLLNAPLPKFNNDAQAAAFLKEFVEKLRVKYRGAVQDADDLQKEFQTERDSFTSSLRQVQSELSFYKSIVSMILTQQEVDKLKKASTYDESTRKYTVPMFILKDESVRLPKSLTDQQMIDLIQKKKKERNMELIKLQPIKTSQESSPTMAKRSNKYFYKPPDLDSEIYQGKNYEQVAENIFAEESLRLAQTNFGFRRLNRQRGESQERRSTSRNTKLKPLEVVPTVKELEPNRPTSRSKGNLPPMK